MQTISAFSIFATLCCFILILPKLAKATSSNPPSIPSPSGQPDDDLHPEVISIPEVSIDETDSTNPIQDVIQVPYPNSPLYLNYLAQAEHLVYNALEKYEDQLLERLQILRRFKNDYKDSVLEAVRQTGLPEANVDDWGKAQIVSSNPILSYRMIRRFAKDLQAFQDHIWHSYENELWEQLEAWRGTYAWPSERDLIESSQSLIRLHDVYDFDINYFSEGEIKVMDKIYPLKVGLMGHHCLEISQLALQLGDINAATEWFQAAHLKVVQDSEGETLTMEELTTVWEKTYNAFLQAWPTHNFKSHDVFSEARTLLRIGFNELKHNRTFENRIINYKALCRGDELRKKTEIARLYCYLDATPNPYWFLNPVKIEVHSWKPLIYQIHDFLGPQKISEINQIVLREMTAVVQSGTSKQQPNDIDSFTHAWVHEDQNASIALYPLTRKIEFIAELDALEFGMSDPYHISSFAVGNHYEPCLECHELHEPDQGGEFAFTLLGVLIKPHLGSLIVYENLLPNEEVNQQNLHGSCPVLIGQKWILTKWIRQ
ncbi:unnamed protein product [Orchesella dallaii]|uniref:Prolyl 4-hydroxylase alpha subunit domain-containing protein n=1 Tax=Orchesella dallaii TaxID=48710 RepID=A0ABP1QPH7_9HEXA